MRLCDCSLRFSSCRVDILLGDSSKAREKLGWKPEVSFEEMIHMMVDEDLKRVKAEINAKEFRNSLK